MAASDDTKPMPPVTGAAPSAWAQRDATRAADKSDSKVREKERPRNAPVSPAARRDDKRCTRKTMRVLIEEISETPGRPEAYSGDDVAGVTYGAKTLLEAAGPNEVVATALRAMATKFDPPFWRIFARMRRNRDR